MNRQTAHEMLKKAFQAAGLNGKLATHSLRKSFAQRVYEESGDIYLVQELLGHRNVSTTQKYIGVNYATAREAVEAMALESKASSEPYRTHHTLGLDRWPKFPMAVYLMLRTGNPLKMRHKHFTTSKRIPADSRLPMANC